MPDPPPAPVDDDLEAWVEVATGLMDRLAAPGRLVVALLGEALVDDHRPWWFGHEPTGSGLGDLLRAVGEEPDAADALLEVEARFVGRRVGRPSDATRARWRARVGAAIADTELDDQLPARDPVHEEAERVWRAAAATQEPWRATRLDPDRALRQVRWYPGCETRTWIGYSDPLGLAAAQRSVSEHRWSAQEDAGLRPVAEVHGRTVDPLTWRLSALRFAADHHDWPAHDDDIDRKVATLLSALGKLPPHRGVSFRGRTADSGFGRDGQVVVTTGLTPTSRSVAVATENFTVPALYVVLGRTGRAIERLSSRPEEQEVVFLPSSMFTVLRSARVDDLPVTIVEQLDPELDEPLGTLEEIAAFTVSRVGEARQATPVEITTPGKFVGDIS